VGGIRFQCPGQELEVGDVVEVTFTLEDHSATVTGKVVHVRELGLLSQEIALAFIEMDTVTLQRLHELVSSGDRER
jgi:hypothetical protein